MRPSSLLGTFLSSRRRFHSARPRPIALPPARPKLELLEDRTLFSESATAQLTLVSTTGTAQNPVYNYDITLNNTGTTKIGTFWFAWVPGEDFLPSLPSVASSPANWGNATGTSATPFFTGDNSSVDGTAIQWVAQNVAGQISPGASLDGFTFSTTDSPSALAGDSPTHPGTPVLTSFVYQGAPEAPPDVNGFEFTVTAAPTQSSTMTTLSPSNAAINFGDSVTFTATVSGTSPTGTVTFQQGGTMIGTGTVQNDGTATFTTSALPVGSDTITAAYGGDSANAPSTSAPLTETVNSGLTTTSLQTSAQSINTGGTAIFTANVAAAISGGPTPTGSVTFTADGNALGTSPVQSDGSASLLSSLGSLATGTHAIVATYSGDSTYASSTSSSLSETISGTAADGSTTTLISSEPTSNPGDTVTFTATVAPATAGGPALTGSVSFSSDGILLGSTTLQNGTAAFSTSTLAGGTHSIVATYSGDANFASSTSPAVPQTVNAPVLVSTTTTLTTTAASIAGGASVTFTATIVPSTSGNTPTGSVNFTADGTTLGAGALQSNGTATFSTTTLSVGTHMIVATYEGDSNFSPSSSSPLTQAVVTPPTLAPTITKSTVPTAIVAGGAAHGAVTVSITNQTAALIKGKSTIEIFASTNGIIDSSAILVGKVIHNLSVKTTKPAVTTVPVKSLLATLAANSYTLLARVVDPSGNNNDSSTGPALTAAAPFISLAEVFTRQTLTGSVATGAKTHAAAAIKITNNGNIVTPGTTTVAFFLSANGVVDSNATMIRSVTKGLRIKPGKSATVALPFKQVPTVAAGTYSIVAQVTDPNGHVTSVVSSTTVTVTA